MPIFSRLLLAPLTLFLLSALTPVFGTHTLRVTNPSSLVSVFTTDGVKGVILSEPSLFGLPNYQDELAGQLKYDSNDKNANGCLPYAADFNPYPADDKPKVVIAITSRGGCSFGTKALMAQQAGARAIIIVNSDDKLPMPKLAGGDDTSSIRIPGMMVKKSDGAKLIEAIPTSATDEKAPVWMSLAYSIVAPDDRVEIDFYTYPDEVSAQQFLTEFADVMPSLGNSVLFTPHYRIVDGEAHQCLVSEEDCKNTAAANLPCGTQCTNCGRYCRIDPNRDLDVHPDGSDQVREAAYGKCVYLHSLEVNQPMLWWNFTNTRANKLKCIKTSPYDFDCSFTAMKQVGISDEDITKIRLCIGDLNANTFAANDLMEAELDWAYDWQPLTSPYLFGNNFTYYGGFMCPAPAGPSTCGPLSMICQGFLPGTAPAICDIVSNGCLPGVERDACGVCGGTAVKGDKCGNGCDAGVERDACGICGGTAVMGDKCGDGCEAGVKRDACGICGGTAVEGDNCDEPSKFPIGPVIGVAIVCCVLLAGAVYWYMRRQNNRMKDDIDSLLKQYLPLDGPGVASSNGKHEPNSNLRLIGNLESSDEPTDL